MSQLARACFVCGESRGWTAFDERWELVGIGSVRMSVRVCSGCGVVLQDPAIPDPVLQRYYAVLSNYTNPGRCGRPSALKMQVVDQQIAFVGSAGFMKGSAFQVGCSDGYTLSRFSDAGWQVDGIDPSQAAHDLAVGLYGLNTRVGFFEDAPVDEKYDVVIATHVLEHLRDPIAALARMRSMLNDRGAVLIEVPCLTDPGLWPNGYFTVEHLQYFSETSLDNCLRAAGFRTETSQVAYDASHYPVVRVVASTSDHAMTSAENDYERAREVIETYLARERDEGWGRISSLLERELNSATRVVIWGAGVHTSQLLARTSLLRLRTPEMIVDSDPQKQGLQLAGIDVCSPDEIRVADGTVLIVSSLGGQREILEATADLRRGGVRVVPLYPVDQEGR